MAWRYLLDTNIVSDLMRNPQGIVASKLAEVGEHAVCTSIVVEAELRFGARKSSSEKLTRRVDEILSALEVMPLRSPADRHYGRVRAHLAQMGAMIGPNDLMIAAHALAQGVAVVTANVDEFVRVPNLHVENWLAAGPDP